MASDPIRLAPLQACIRDLVAWSQSEGVPLVLVGGVAVSLLGRPRVTRDVDAVVFLAEDRWAAFLASGAAFGFFPRASDVLAFAQQTRVLLVAHQPSGIDADLSFAALPFEEEMRARATTADIGGAPVPLPTPEDLIILKAVAHRPRDLADIEGLLDAQPRLDLRRVRRWVRQFAEVLEAPELLADVEAILRARGQRRQRRARP
jgi:hypothetical protein